MRGVDTSLWGEGSSKGVESLFQELVAGESQLVLNTLGELVRSVTVVSVAVRRSEVTPFPHMWRPHFSHMSEINFFF